MLDLRSLFFITLISLFFEIVHSQTFLRTNLKFNDSRNLILKANSGTSGIAIADYNLDGNLDIYFVVKERANNADESSKNRLFAFDGESSAAVVGAQPLLCVNLT